MDELKFWLRKNPEPGVYILADHCGQFNNEFRNIILDQVPPGSVVYSEYIFPDEVKQAYAHLELKFFAWEWLHGNGLPLLQEIDLAPRPLALQNFLSTFNRSDHIGRHWLVAKLIKRGWFDPEHSTKHWPLDYNSIRSAGISTKGLDKTLANNVFVEDFADPTNHKHNFASLYPKISKSFVNLVSETINSQSTVAFPTEKFLFPILSKNLWLAWAPPNYHKLINQKFGFKLYPCFDYRFDSIWDPISRLDALLDALKPFASCTQEQWHAIYEEQKHVIQYNHDHLRNFGFLEKLVELDDYQQAYNVEYFNKKLQSLTTRTYFRLKLQGNENFMRLSKAA